MPKESLLWFCICGKHKDAFGLVKLPISYFISILETSIQKRLLFTSILNS